MKPTNTDARRVLILVALCALLVTGAWGAAPTGSSQGNVTVAAVDVHGQQVQVTVVNSGVATATATISIRVIMEDGSQTSASSTVSVFGRQKAFVGFSLRSTVKDVLDAGMIVDDPGPF